jgi:DNA-binding MarR family transcriptional regulator
MTPGALASAEAVKPQSITRVLAELERSGLVRRTQDADDRRQFKVELTTEGGEVLQREARQRALWLASAIDSHLTQIERDLLGLTARILDRLTAI